MRTMHKWLVLALCVVAPALMAPTGGLPSKPKFANVTATPASGVALQINTPAATLANSINITGSTTAGSYLWMTNTGGGLFVGLENSAGNALLLGSQPYATVITSTNATPLCLGTNVTSRMCISSAGAVTIDSVPVLPVLLSVQALNGGTNTTTTLQDATGTFASFPFPHPSAATSTWLLETQFYFEPVSSDAGGFKFAIVCTDGSGVFGALTPNGGEVLANFNGTLVGNVGAVGPAAGGASGTVALVSGGNSMRFYSTVTVAASTCAANTLKVQFAKNAAASGFGLILDKGSWVKLTRIT
jgi:DNA/RNA endonuclease YhcR with UshA esterase domain